MDTEVKAVIEQERDVESDSCPEIPLLELGQVSTDTEGWGWVGGFDGGPGWRW